METDKLLKCYSKERDSKLRHGQNHIDQRQPYCLQVSPSVQLAKLAEIFRLLGQQDQVGSQDTSHSSLVAESGSCRGA